MNKNTTADRGGRPAARWAARFTFLAGLIAAAALAPAQDGGAPTLPFPSEGGASGNPALPEMTSGTVAENSFGPPGGYMRGGGFRGGFRMGLGGRDMGGRGLMGRRGMGGFGGGGFGGFGRGGPGAMPPRPLPPHWEDMDQMLQDCLGKYERLEQQHEKKLQELDALKKNYRPEKIDPSTVVLRNSIDKVLAELHQNVEDSRDNTQTAGVLLAGVINTRHLWEASVRQGTASGSPRTAQPPAAGGGGSSLRREAWLKGLDRWTKEGPDGFAKAVLGDQFGSLALQSIPDRMWRPGGFPMEHDDGPGPGLGRGMIMNEIRQNWLGRIDRMERQQEELSNELRQQERELHQMRMLLEGFLTQSGMPAEGPGAKAGPVEANAQNPPSPPNDGGKK